MPSDLILLVDDEPSIIQLARLYLEREGFRIGAVGDGQAALEAVATQRPALIVLDIMLPKLDGFEVCRQLRAKNDPVAILMLTARDEDIDKILGLEMGADDYLTKPFNPRELVARVRAVLRRAETRPSGPAQPDVSTHLLDDLRIEVGAREVFVHDQLVPLTPKEFDLLVTLVENRGLVLTREQLLERVWGFTFLGDSRTIDVHVRQLRRKLGDSCPIQTVWGTGYKVPARR
jgi:DNA-binding response OmpR family regulator